MARRHYLVTYDIADDKRRTKVFKTLEDNGDHVQFSVFFCQLNERERVVLQGALSELIHRDQDQVLVLDLGSSETALETALQCLGRRYEPPTRVQVV
ncbi:MAG: CRISPR-associated endonuclease Cas2 [Lentisphaerae bacterium RIFOXYB12_FULL_65_16]|nr:MAG: CRISPR-associated endonuclease Cas2 [Lentisphaerae bacterium RIFOXYA12_64_32]OGV93887.1 MAG: CRISPR-associated endonuclease Cas2 [Lentisphaerae bacterium RIFOXYB12_FULL_65_16]